MTGLSYFNEAIVGKRLELLKELVTGLTRIAVLRNPMQAVHATFWHETELAARKLGLTLQPLDVRGQVRYVQDHTVPSTGFLLATIGHWTRTRCPGTAQIDLECPK